MPPSVSTGDLLWSLVQKCRSPEHANGPALVTFKAVIHTREGENTRIVIKMERVPRVWIRLVGPVTEEPCQLNWSMQHHLISCTPLLGRWLAAINGNLCARCLGVFLRHGRGILLSVNKHGLNLRAILVHVEPRIAPSPLRMARFTVQTA
jgi:hypothetical protein